MVESSRGTRNGATFDIEEFKALRQEILQKVDAAFRLEVYAVTGVAAVYAWLVTQRAAIPRSVWFIPVLFPLLGLLRAKTLGHQMVVAGKYLRLLEKRMRPKGLDDEGDIVHGWEGYLHRSDVWRTFVDWVSTLFWLVFIGLTVWLAVTLPSD